MGINVALSKVPFAPPISLLTARELEFVRLLAAGHTKKAIGLTMGVAEKTVAAHAQKVFKKLRIHDRAILVHWALHQNLIPNHYTLPLPSNETDRQRNHRDGNQTPAQATGSPDLPSQVAQPGH